MVLHAEEYALSGLSTLPFEDAAHRLLDLSPELPAARLTLTSEGDQKDLVHGPRTTLGDVAVSEHDISEARRLDLVVDPHFDGVAGRVRVSLVRSQHTLVDGQPYISQLVEDASAPVPALEALAGWSVALAERLDCPVLGLGLENLPGNTIGDLGQVLAPSVFVVLPRRIVESAEQQLDASGTRVVHHGSRSLIWLLAPESLVLGREPGAVVRGEIAALTAAALPH